MTPKTQALIARTLLGIFLVEVPVLTLELSKPVPDYRLLALGLLGGLAAYLDKALSPQLADHLLPDAQSASGQLLAPTSEPPATPVPPVA